MHDEHRRYDHCIFCSGTDLTAEHIFGKALARRVGLKDNWTAAEHRADGAFAPVKGGSPILSVTANLLCEACNTRDLSAEMNAAVDVVYRMANGEKLELSDTQVTAVRRYVERVALIVDVITSNHHVTEKQKESKDYKRSARYRQQPPVFSDEARARWRAGGSLDGLDVYVGFHDGVLGLNPHVNIAHRFVMKGPDRVLSPSKGLVFVIKGLAVYVGMDAPPIRGPEEAWVKLSRETPSLNWPTSPKVDYADVFVLEVPTTHLQMLALYLSIPDARVKIEDYSRAVGGFDLPPDIHDFVDAWLAEQQSQPNASP